MKTHRVVELLDRVRALAIPAVSLIIVACLGLQFVVISRVLWAPDALSHIYAARWVRPSATWPILDYPMYSEAHREGETIAAHQVVATADDGTEVVLRPEDRSIAPRTSALLIPLIRKDQERVDRYREAYRRRTGRTLVAFRLEDHVLVLTRGGFVAREEGARAPAPAPGGGER